METLQTNLRDGKTPHILVVGDVMLDVHVSCIVTGLSPEDDLAWKLKESSVQVRPGGAANVALNLAKLGAIPYLISVVGDDSEANRLREAIAPRLGVVSSLIQQEDRPTTTKTRYLTQHGRHIARVDRESTAPISKNTLEKIGLFIKSIWASGTVFDAIVVSDYEKGVVSRDLMNFLTPLQKPIIVDPKINFFKYGPGVFALTPNEKEFNESRIENPFTSPQAKFIVKKLSERGCQLQQRESDPSRPDSAHYVCRNSFKTHARKLGDPTGCGDSFLAAFAMAIGMGWVIEEACMLGNAAGAVAFNFTGAHAVTRDELVAELQSFDYEA